MAIPPVPGAAGNERFVGPVLCAFAIPTGVAGLGVPELPTFCIVSIESVGRDCVL